MRRPPAGLILHEVALRGGAPDETHLQRRSVHPGLADRCYRTGATFTAECRLELHHVARQNAVETDLRSLAHKPPPRMGVVSVRDSSTMEAAAGPLSSGGGTIVDLLRSNSQQRRLCTARRPASRNGGSTPPPWTISAAGSSMLCDGEIDSISQADANFESTQVRVASGTRGVLNGPFVETIWPAMSGESGGRLVRPGLLPARRRR